MMKISANAFFPVVITDKVEECKHFYTQYFDFNPVYDAGWYCHLVSEKGIQIGLLAPGHESQPDLFKQTFSQSFTSFAQKTGASDISLSPIQQVQN
jgi:hypothetical protein